jgi:transposase
MRKEIIKLHEQGLSYREIANKLGKSKSLVAYYIRTKDCD